jgi:hypothetical protein
MKVEELRKPAEVEQKNKETTLQPISNTSFNAPESHKAATKKEQSTAEGEMNVGLGDIVDQALRDVEDEAMKTGGRRKKKRGQRR